MGGNLEVHNNVSLVHPLNDEACPGTFPAGCEAAPGADEDAAEVQWKTSAIREIRNTWRATWSARATRLRRTSTQLTSEARRNVVDGNKVGQCSSL